MRGWTVFGVVAAAVALAGFVLSAGASASKPRQEGGLTRSSFFLRTISLGWSSRCTTSASI